MKLQATVAAIAMMVGGAAQAAMVDLTYDVEAQLTSYSYVNPNFEFNGLPYPGPEVGDILTYSFSINLDPSTTSGSSGDQFNPKYYGGFDNQTGAGNFLIALSADELQEFDLNDQGTGEMYQIVTNYGDPLIYSYEYYDVLSYSFSGLPDDIAPVPLPASLPLLGLAMVFLFRRRKAA